MTDTSATTSTSATGNDRDGHGRNVNARKRSDVVDVALSLAFDSFLHAPIASSSASGGDLLVVPAVKDHLKMAKEIQGRLK